MLEAHFPGSTHVRDDGLARADADTIWKYAADHGFAVVSKDSDFHQRRLTLSAPPKFIWVRVGDASTAAIGALIIERRAELEAFTQDTEATFAGRRRLGAMFSFYVCFFRPDAALARLGSRTDARFSVSTRWRHAAHGSAKRTRWDQH